MHINYRIKEFIIDLQTRGPGPPTPPSHNAHFRPTIENYPNMTNTKFIATGLLSVNIIFVRLY